MSEAEEQAAAELAATLEAGRIAAEKAALAEVEFAAKQAAEIKRMDDTVNKIYADSIKNEAPDFWMQIA